MRLKSNLVHALSMTPVSISRIHGHFLMRTLLLALADTILLFVRRRKWPKPPTIKRILPIDVPAIESWPEKALDRR